MAYRLSESYLEVNLLDNNQSQANNFELNRYGQLSFKGSVLEDPSIGDTFIFDAQGNITASKIVEKHTI
jgi:hypothetical protein